MKGNLTLEETRLTYSPISESELRELNKAINTLNANTDKTHIEYRGKVLACGTIAILPYFEA